MLELNADLKEKIAMTLTAAAAAFVVTKAIETGWKLATGNTPPSEDDVDDSTLKVVLFAGATAMAVAWARQATLKKTSSYIAAHPFNG